ncbi:DUF317 domain-containing protein [Streptomyces sp. NPDC054919]
MTNDHTALTRSEQADLLTEAAQNVAGIPAAEYPTAAARSYLHPVLGPLAAGPSVITGLNDRFEGFVTAEPRPAGSAGLFAEMVASLTAALVQDYGKAIASDTPGRFLTGPTVPWRETVRPLIDAGWNLDGGAELGTVEIIAPDYQAGILIDRRGYGSDRRTVELWAGPPGWGARAEATFTVRTPSHLIAATAAVMAKSTPVVRERHHIDRRMQHLVTMTRVASVTPIADAQVSRAPTPLDVRRTAVTQAVHRAARAPRTAADLRVMTAQSRSAEAAQNRSGYPAPATAVRLPASSSAPRHGR